MTTRKIIKFLGKQQRILIFFIILLVLFFGYWAISVQNRTANSTNKNTGTETSVDQNPTAAVKQQTEASKNQSAQPIPGSSSTNSSNQKQVTPIITNANQDQINGYVPGIFEDGGTCTATLTKGSNTLTKTSRGFQNVSYTSCEPINLNGLLKESGNWNLILSYSSPTAVGSSTKLTFVVK